MDIKKNSFTEWVVKAWNRLPRTVVGSPSLGMFGELVVVALEDIT